MSLGEGRRREVEKEKPEMSLVDYASSDDDDDVSSEEEEEQDKQNKENKENEPTQQQAPVEQQTQSFGPSNRIPQTASRSSAPSIQKLPDASQLFDSPDFSPSTLSGSHHSSHSGGESSSRKREPHPVTSSIPRSKVPRGNFPHSRNFPDTIGGLLVPPQLNGRSNVVTEDVSKLFVKKPVSGSPQ